ncbi:MAG: NADH-quinone oxidoreductase subunit N [Peptococcaceae bacterium]|nr:NADH-quinone oxidoreductase subunit N [Peptococcaceae bacterium]
MQMDFSVIIPEIAMVSLGVLVLILGLILPKKSLPRLGWFTSFSLIGILALVVLNWNNVGTVSGGLYLIDQFSQFFKVIFLTAAILVVFGSMAYVDKHLGGQAEYYSILVFSTLGMMVMASANDFITMYLGLELMTISFIVLVCFRRNDSESLEAGMKYVLLAGISSAVLLYGLSLIYGIAGTVLVVEVGMILAVQQSLPLLLVGVVMLVAGLGFKIAAVPFHMWAPDVYQGAPTPITSFLAVGSKMASFAILIRIFVLGMFGVSLSWGILMAILAGVTIIIGNLVAIPQTNIKRLMAYSGIAQAGYILVGMVTASQAGVKAIMFYGFIYIFAVVGVFTAISYYYNLTGSDEIKDYAGLSQRSPLMAATMVVSMLTMAGIPPFAGFVGKFYLFMTVVENYLWLAIIGLIMSMVSVYYYLMVVLVMYRDRPQDSSPIVVSLPVRMTLIFTMLVSVVLGVYPGPLSEIINKAALSFFMH